MDNGGEFLNKKFKDYMQLNGIIRFLSCPYTSPHNGMVECQHQTLLQTVRCSFTRSKMAFEFWTKAVVLSTQLTGYQHTILAVTHHSSFYYIMLKAFGLSLFFINHSNKIQIARPFNKCVFISYYTNHKGYKCMEIECFKDHISRQCLIL